MKKSTNLEIIVSIVSFLLFLLLLALLKFVDVSNVGVNKTFIGLSSLNVAVKNAIGTNEFWYQLTEIFGYLAIAVIGFFAIRGLYQLIKEKSFKKIDKHLYYLAGFYALVIVTYVVFEIFVVNYRPILNEDLEPSFPSSHTMLIVCVLSSAIYEFNRIIKDKKSKTALSVLFLTIIILTIIGRTLSGVHWFTDILGGVFISVSYVSLYISVVKKVK